MWETANFRGMWISLSHTSKNLLLSLYPHFYFCTWKNYNNFFWNKIIWWKFVSKEIEHVSRRQIKFFNCYSYVQILLLFTVMNDQLRGNNQICHSRCILRSPLVSYSICTILFDWFHIFFLDFFTLIFFSLYGTINKETQ